MHFRLQTDWPYFRTDYNSATAKSRQKTELPWAARRDFDGIGFPPLRSVCCLPGLYRKTCTNLEPIFTLGTQLAFTAFGMDPLTASAASGLQSRMDSFDMLGNNLANASTSG